MGAITGTLTQQEIEHAIFQSQQILIDVTISVRIDQFVFLQGLTEQTMIEMTLQSPEQLSLQISPN